MEQNNSISIIDDFFSEEMYNGLLRFLDLYGLMKYGWKSNDETDDHGHWTAVFSGTDRQNKVDATNRLPHELAEPWQRVRSVMKDKSLVTCYMNGHTYGVDGYFHSDSNEDEYSTAIVYIVDGKWNPDWGGETAFLDDRTGEIKASILPKRNRVVIFP